MANTDKQNFRCDGETRWRPAMERLEQMRADGYDVDMTKVLGSVVDTIRDTPDNAQLALKLKQMGISL